MKPLNYLPQALNLETAADRFVLIVRPYVVWISSPISSSLDGLSRYGAQRTPSVPRAGVAARRHRAHYVSSPRLGTQQI